MEDAFNFWEERTGPGAPIANPKPPGPMFKLTATLCHCLIEIYNLNIDMRLYRMFLGKEQVNFIQGFGVEISLPAVGAYFGIDVFDDVQLFVESVLSFYRFPPRISAAKAAFHNYCHEIKYEPRSKLFKPEKLPQQDGESCLTQIILSDLPCAVK